MNDVYLLVVYAEFIIYLGQIVTNCFVIIFLAKRENENHTGLGMATLADDYINKWRGHSGICSSEGH